ncbi:Transmembrane protein [Halotydeus destructor]|nr:Transmembrane protein [Halotydeus destructor]
MIHAIRLSHVRTESFAMSRQPFETNDFKYGDLDTIINVLGLSPQDPLDTFIEMWYQVFLWALFSSFLVHLIAAGFAFTSLRMHKVARFAPIFILAAGIVTPFTVSLVTSAVIAGVYRAASFKMVPLYALFYGIGQTVTTLAFAYSRILATL